METNVYRMKSHPIEPAEAGVELAPLYERSKKENKMVPNMFKVMGNHPSLLETYMNGYTAFRSKSGFTPSEQEVVLLTISAENNCTYCIEGHSIAADLVSKVPVEVTEAIRNNTEIPDEKLKQLSAFTSIMVNKRGHPAPSDVEQFLKAGYTEFHILSIIQAIAIKTISNYSNHLFNTDLDSVMKMREKTGYKIARRVFKFFKG